MRKGRIFKSLAVVLIAVMVIGGFSLSGNDTQAATNYTTHVDIRTNAAVILDENGNIAVSGITIPKTNFSYVGYSLDNGESYTECTNHNEQLDSSRSKYEVKYGAKKYGEDLFNVYDENLRISIKGTFSDGNEFELDINSTTQYPANTYVEYESSYQGASASEKAMKLLGSEKVRLADNKYYYPVGGLNILDVAIAMCNGVKVSGNTITVCGVDFYLSPEVIEKIDPDVLTVVKDWTNVEGDLIPSNVEVQLYKDGVAVEGKSVVLSAANNWTADIHYTKEEGSAYTVKETKINGVAVENSGFTYTVGDISSYGAISLEDSKVSLDTVKEDNGRTSYTYFVDAVENSFAIAKLADNVALNDENANKDVKFVVWTNAPLPDEDKATFIAAINEKGDISGLTLENTIFKTGLDADAFEYKVGENTLSSEEETIAYGSVSNKYIYDSEALAKTAMNAQVSAFSTDPELKAYGSVKDARVYVVSGALTDNKQSIESSRNYDSENSAKGAMNGEVANYKAKGYTVSNETVVPHESYTEYDKSDNSGKSKNESAAQTALDKAIKDYKKQYGESNFVLVESKTKKISSKKYGYTLKFKIKTVQYGYKFTISKPVDTRKWSFELDIDKIIGADTRETRNLSFAYNKNLNQENFNFSNRTDWEYFYKGVFTSETIPAENTLFVYNTYGNDTIVTGSKTFDMKSQADIAVPVDQNGNPNITLDVYKDNGKLNGGYSVIWVKDNTTANKWNFTISGDAITKYSDSDNNGKLDTLAVYEIREAGEENGKITLGNFDYDVTYADGNAITNSLDTSEFVGSIRINKTIDDINTYNGDAIFTYKIEGEENTYYAIIAINNETLSGSAIINNLKIGEYEVTELSTMRFAMSSVSPETGIVTVEREQTSNIDFANTLKVTKNFSHTDASVSHFVIDADGAITTSYESRIDLEKIIEVIEAQQPVAIVVRGTTNVLGDEEE